MFNLNFTNLEECKRVNNLDEKALVAHLQASFKNANYRKSYNHKRNELTKALNNDPVVAKRVAELKSKIAK